MFGDIEDDPDTASNLFGDDPPTVFQDALESPEFADKVDDHPAELPDTFFGSEQEIINVQQQEFAANDLFSENSQEFSTYISTAQSPPKQSPYPANTIESSDLFGPTPEDGVFNNINEPIPKEDSQPIDASGLFGGEEINYEDELAAEENYQPNYQPQQQAYIPEEPTPFTSAPQGQPYIFVPGNQLPTSAPPQPLYNQSSYVQQAPPVTTNAPTGPRIYVPGQTQESPNPTTNRFEKPPPIAPQFSNTQPYAPNNQVQQNSPYIPRAPPITPVSIPNQQSMSNSRSNPVISPNHNNSNSFSKPPTAPYVPGQPAQPPAEHKTENQYVKPPPIAPVAAPTFQRPNAPFVPVFNPAQQPHQEESHFSKPPTTPMFVPGQNIQATQQETEPIKNIPTYVPSATPMFIPASTNNLGQGDLYETARAVKSLYGSDFSSRQFISQAKEEGSSEKQLMSLLSEESKEAEEESQFDEVYQALSQNGVEAAIELCIENSYWDIALILANSVSQEKYIQISQKLISSKLNNSTLGNALTVYTGTPLSNSKETLKYALLNYNSTSISALKKTGDSSCLLFVPEEKPTHVPAPTQFVPTNQEYDNIENDDDPFNQDYEEKKKEEEVKKPQPKKEMPKVEKKKPLEPEPLPDDDDNKESSGWFGGLFSKLNPFSRKSKVVDLSEHEGEELVWNGRRYVTKGHENDEDEPDAPPPPPVATTTPTNNEPTPGITPGQPALRSGGRTRAASRYVNTF